MKKNETTFVYVLSSISILCCCFGGLGILLALPAYLHANKLLKNATLEADLYDANFFKSMNNAKTFALVAVIINAVYLAYSIYFFSSNPWSQFMEGARESYEFYRN